MLKKFYNYYIFIEELSEIIKKKILQLPNTHVILNFKIFNENFFKQVPEIIKFCRKYQISFYIIDNIKIAKKLKANGVFISSNNRKIGLCLDINSKIELLGSAHNQLEYFFKLRQNCKTLMLSPIFYNNKYSFNKILSPVKFNLISLHWKTNICALGGISNNNIKKIKITKAKSVGIKSWINKKAHLPT